MQICDLYCEMDTEQVPTFDTLMPNQEGELIKTNRSGKDEFITGRYFVIRRPVPFDESSNSTLKAMIKDCLLYTSPSPRDKRQSRMPSSA